MLYIHIPFCKQLCAYCDFYFSVSLERKAQMVRALLQEMEARKNYLPSPYPLPTLYFGGGTPSVLTPEELRLLIEKARQVAGTGVFEELTMEVNPDDITRGYVEQLRALGVNRLSIGIQSFQDKQLQFLRRRHSAQQAIESVKVAQAAGFGNITIDLMYGLPGQTLEEWQQDILQALQLDVPHISAYHLAVEPATLFGRQHAKGLLELPGEELSEQQFLYLHDILERAGYEHYEVSNFARSNYRAVHNSGYWKGFPYIGIGPSAHSYDGESRQWNVANNIRYLEAIENGLPAFEKETLTVTMRFNEYLLTSLRTAEGADLDYVAETFGACYQNHCMQKAAPYIAAGTLVKIAGRLQIPPRNFLVSDSIIRDLFWE